MKIIALAAAAGLIALAGCGASTGSGTQNAAAPASGGPSCHAQYETWKNSTARAQLAAFTGALHAVQSAGNTEDLLKLRSSLERAARASTRLASTPPPKCADPHHYYPQLLGRITAAGDNAKTAGGLGGLILAKAPLQKVPVIERKLKSELDQTVGVKR